MQIFCLIEIKKQIRKPGSVIYRVTTQQTSIIYLG